MKKTICMLLALTLLAAFPVYAVQSRGLACIPTLEFCGTEADCALMITGNKLNDFIVAEMQLKHGKNVVASWSGSGYNIVSISGTADVTIGYTYELHINYSINGVQKPPIVISKTND